jgi:hypothetical protein
MECDHCGFDNGRVVAEVIGFAGHGREERERRNTAQAKKGSELFNGESEQFRPIQPKPIQQVGDTPAVPIASHETVTGSFDEYPDRYFLDDDPDYEPPSPEPDDYDPADYADLGAAE